MNFNQTSCKPWFVCKFGGSSVATASNWHKIRQITHHRLQSGKRPLLVCSALSGVTTCLARLFQAASHGEPSADDLHELKHQHLTLAADLGLDGEQLIAQRLELLLGLLAEVHSRGASPRLEALVMAQGELLSTLLGAAFLAETLQVHWLDARALLCSEQVGEPHGRDYLSARVETEPDSRLRAQLEARDGALITQGYIARNPEGDTVLLGRGGSDTSAAIFAAKLAAERLEIWTDVPGMFTANPRLVPEARMLRRLGYDEAEALALAGGKVLHPRCIEPLRAQGIPLHIRCTARPDLDGTVIARRPADAARIGAVTSRSGLLRIRAQTSGSGSLNLLGKFSDSLLSRDLQVNMLQVGHRAMGAVIDPLITPVSRAEVQHLLAEINDYAEAELETELHSLSLVGQGLDQLHHAWSPLLQWAAPGELCQIGANSALDVTLLLNGSDPADEMVPAVHEALLATPCADETFGPTWLEIAAALRESEAVAL